MKIRLVLAFTIVMFSSMVNAQFSGTALTEYQYGKLPNEKADEFNSIYSRVNLNYTLNEFKFGAGMQLYQSPYGDRNYIDLAQARASYQTKRISVQLGNYSEILGKGILLRNYEIPGAVIEDLSFRSKQYFYTDMLGGAFNYKMDKWSAKVLWGYALNNLQPPTEEWEQRRPDEVLGAEFTYNIGKQKVELSGLSLSNQVEESYYAMGGLTGNILPDLSYYVGYADYLGGTGKSVEEQDAFAIYGNIGWSLNNFGLSLEYKKYQNFLIGNGINEPPALVREHSYKLLNRSTHVLQPVNESGIQLEAFYQPGLFSLITFNYTYARNDFAKIFDYNEWFLEYSGVVFQEGDIKLFADYALDPFKDEDNRVTAGFYLDNPVSDTWGLIIEGEAQGFERPDAYVNNYLLGLTVRNKSKLYFGLNTEWSNDRYISETDKIWIGGNARYKLNSKNTFQLFAGERRGGPACSAGVCYEVLDFKGVELRWTARL
ncbi:DUF6029 family protein [Labilibacter marinus]|uniref:DUF6029 family protein n=1 Tax=Labilibacter marinus TaxID=1477105 RepID=UPI00094F5398|nr:DUF6029 family protein [Labilibacter marinus]